jgi:putative transcriptional regulator
MKQAIQETVLSLYNAGLMSEKKVRSFSALKNWKPPQRPFSAEAIRRLRRRHKVSQPQFARLLGIGKTTVQQWEQGVKRPSGPSLKLLNIIDKHGLEVLR